MAISILNKDQNHAISRSAELLSVAKTSLRILQQQHQQQTGNETLPLHQELQSLDPNNLTLHDERIHPSNAALDALDEASLTLSLLDSTLDTLRNLVKRRGATNDPTEQINEAIASFHNYSKGILEVIQNALPQSAVLSPYDDRIVKATSQRVKHYEIVASVLQTNIEKRNQDFKSIMTLRGDILKEQTLRRKKLLSSNNNATKIDGTAKEGELNGNSTSVPLAPSSGGVRLVGKGITAPQRTERLAKSQLMTSPLFTAVLEPPKSGQLKNNGTGGNNTSKSSANLLYKQHTAPNLYGSESKVVTTNGGYRGLGYGKGCTAKYGGGGAGGAGGGVNPYDGTSNSFGVRRRVGGSSNLKVHNGDADANQEEESKIHDSNSVMAQIQMRRESRQTQQRLESARQAERSLAELTTMFSKMSNLIQSQGETLVKIEDDVEAAMDHVEAGREEIVKLYEWTKGNRGLIIKVFALLIFFIVFMRFYG
eukprot:CAMPEP_0176486540 /NCGR_PEP_ID=MMETSP0200_2-20121128/5619_1 /TAXON_ID=947934 /ORGANISM="Chaetoceros sp., Strain GSL56" /LENGTH=480 /DNA_ID=CAMNT_0017883241 /DNA_START=80 /DNA_END=1522 /DNA_ORIENTATION=-